jgi:type I restriction enzyme S subunit
MNHSQNKQDFEFVGLDTLPRGWEYKSLGQLVDPKRGISYGVVQPGSHSDDGIPIVRVNNLHYGHLSTNDVLKVSPEIEKAYQRTRLRGGEVLLSLVGSLGQTTLVSKELIGWNVARAIAVIPVLPDISSEWVNYALRSPQLQHLIHTWATTTVQATLNLGDVIRLPIPIAPEKERDVIIEILSALDDKIELNRRMNQTIESMTRAVFRQWFIDDEESSNWEEISLGHFAHVVDCMHSKKPDREPEGKPLIQLWNIRDDGLLDMTDTYLITEESYKHWVSRIEASPGDCVITNTGRVAAIAQIPEGYKAALGRNMTAIRCKKQYPYPTFLLECLRSDSMRQEIDRKTDVGTILNSLNVRNIPTLRFKLPPQDTMENYEKFARPLRAMMEKNLQQSRTLATLHATLLPKLMRGEVRVKL